MIVITALRLARCQHKHRNALTRLDVAKGGAYVKRRTVAKRLQ